MGRNGRPTWCLELGARLREFVPSMLYTILCEKTGVPESSDKLAQSCFAVFFDELLV